MIAHDLITIQKDIISGCDCDCCFGDIDEIGTEDLNSLYYDISTESALPIRVPPCHTFKDTYD